MSEADLIYWKKGRFLMNSGKTINIEMDIWLVPKPKRHLYPEGLKFGWIAFNKENPKERISLSSWQSTNRKVRMKFFGRSTWIFFRKSSRKVW